MLYQQVTSLSHIAAVRQGDAHLSLTDLHAAGPFCHRALLTLAEKHVPYKEEYIDFSNKPKW
jgi:hypothetical protein